MTKKAHNCLACLTFVNMMVSKVVGGLLLVVLLLIGLQRFTSLLDNYHLRTVLTNSMSESMPAGSLILTKKVEDSELQEGDVISFIRSGETVTHRIKKIENRKKERVYITKGDSNSYADQGYVSEKAIQGKAIGALPKVGAWLLRFKQPRGNIALLLALWAFYLFESLIEQITELKNKKSEDEHYENA